MKIRKIRGPRTDLCGTPAGSNTAYPRLASANVRFAKKIQSRSKYDHACRKRQV